MSLVWPGATAEVVRCSVHRKHCLDESIVDVGKELSQSLGGQRRVPQRVRVGTTVPYRLEERQYLRQGNARGREAFARAKPE